MAEGQSAFSAQNLRQRMAQREAVKAAEEAQRLGEEEARKKALIDEFHKPPERTEDQLMALVDQMVSRAADRGESQVQIYQFPSTLCKDSGRSINNSLPNWVDTLDGRPRLAYEFWRDRLRPLGFGLKAEILDYPGGMPGDVGFILSW